MKETEPEFAARIQEELKLLKDNGGPSTELILNEGYYVLYKSVKTGGLSKGLPEYTDVLVPIPSGYPAAQIDMPALPSDSKLIPRVAGGSNPQKIINACGIEWKLLSYHPYNNGGGGPWNPNKHGFYDYFNQLFTWLHKLN